MDEETVRAGAEAAKEIAVTGGKAIDLLGSLKQYIDGVLRERGGIAEDNMRFRRFENWLKLCGKAQKLLSERGLEGVTREIPPKFALPLVTYGSLEDDEELQNTWAMLLANAADASTPIELRTAYVDMLKDLTAFDVKILSMLAKLSMSDLPQEYPPLIDTWELPKDASQHTNMSPKPERLSAEVGESLSNLARAGCIAPTYGFGGVPMYSQVAVTPMGLGLYRACSPSQRK